MKKKPKTMEEEYMDYQLLIENAISVPQLVVLYSTKQRVNKQCRKVKPATR